MDVSQWGLKSFTRVKRSVLTIRQYHDDGEQELGETVASISLGAPAKMRFRIKAKHMSSYKLWEPKNAPNEVKVESQVQQAVSVEEVQPEDNEGDEDPDEERARPSVTPAKKEIHKEPRVKLELRLNHGDVVVMKGREIQRIWEVSLDYPEHW